jgi:putative sigma-54 modulation protein
MISTTIEAPFTISDDDRKIMQDKMNDLQKYESRMTQINVYFKDDDGKGHEDMLAQIRVRVPGADLFAENTDESAMRAFNMAYNAVKRQVKDRRSKLNDHHSNLKENIVTEI